MQKQETPTSLDNQYVQQYEEFLKIPESQREKYNLRIMKVPMQNSDLELPICNPTYYQKIQASGEKSLDLVIYVWETQKDPKNILFINHGLNGNINAFQALAKQISEKTSTLVIGHDARHFGRSDGMPRGLIRDPNKLFQDAQKVIQWGVSKYGQTLNIFLLGLSMGGRIVLQVANRKKFNYKGAILISPSLVSNPASKLNLGLIGKLKMMFFPTSQLIRPTYKSSCRHSRFVDAKIKPDPYIYQGALLAGTYNSIGSMIQSSKQAAREFDLPYLFIQSGVDKVVDAFQIRDFDRWTQSSDKTNFFVKDMWHSACFDQQFVKMIPEIIKWLLVRLK